MPPGRTIRTIAPLALFDMAIDVTDATFETEVIQRSFQSAVVVDLWASWCGPCKTLGPILEKVCEATDGQVVLAKVDVDANPALSQAFQVQSIPAVYAIKDGKVVDGFMGAYPEHVVQQFVDSLMPSEADQTIAGLIAAGDELSLRRALEIEPGNEQAVCALAELLVHTGRELMDEALQLLTRIPENDQTRRIAAVARLARTTMDAPAAGDVGLVEHRTNAAVEQEQAPEVHAPTDTFEAELDALLEFVKADEDARQKYLDILAVMGPEDPRTARYRKLLTHRLY
jgi:putative thioredoxin